MILPVGPIESKKCTGQIARLQFLANARVDSAALDRRRRRQRVRGALELPHPTHLRDHQFAIGFSVYFSNTRSDTVTVATQRSASQILYKSP